MMLRQAACYSIEVKGLLEHAVTNVPLPGWKSRDDIEWYMDSDMGDYVVYNDWVGQVCTSFVMPSRVYSQALQVVEVCTPVAFLRPC